MSELALINPLQASKAEIAEYGKRINERVAEGVISAKDALIFATRLNKFADAILTKELRKLAADEAEKYGKGDREYLGCKMTVTHKEGDPPVYDFNAVPAWREVTDLINVELAQIETKHANAELLCIENRARILVLEARLKEVELSSIKEVADSLGELHETAIVVKEATKSTKSVSITIK